MSDSFVQQHSGPARTENNFHLSCRSFTRVKLNDRLACGFVREVLRSLFLLEVFDTDAPSAARVTARGALAIFRDAEHAHARQGLGIGSDYAI